MHASLAGQRVKKSVAGFDLTRLFVGSEGTLGVITEATLRVYPLLAHRAAALVSFATLDALLAAVQALVALGMPLNMCELLDRCMVECVNAKMPQLDLPRDSELLYLELGANDAAYLRTQLEIAQQECARHGGNAARTAHDDEACERLFAARKAALLAATVHAPAASVLTTDMCLPLSALTAFVRDAARLVAASALHAPLVGHVADGNLHYFVCCDEAHVADARRLNEQLVRLAIERGGTATGEHGVGSGKRHFLPLELGEPALAAMRAVKSALDPHQLLNPGKVLQPTAKL